MTTRNPHYDTSGGVTPPSLPLIQGDDDFVDAPPSQPSDFCRRCFMDIRFDTRAGRLIALNPDGTLHPCEGA